MKQPSSLTTYLVSPGWAVRRCGRIWRARRDLNPRPTAPEAHPVTVRRCPPSFAWGLKYGAFV